MVPLSPSGCASGFSFAKKKTNKGNSHPNVLLSFFWYVAHNQIQTLPVSFDLLKLAIVSFTCPRRIPKETRRV